MRKIALHYPELTPRWGMLLPAALFYPKIALMRPRDFTIYEDSEVTELRNELDLIVDVDPRAAAQAIAPKFVEAIERYTGREHPYVQGRHTSVHWAPSETTLRSAKIIVDSEIHHEKLDSTVEEAFKALGLAKETNDPLAPWLLVERGVANVYLCVLAEELARQNHMQAVTNHEWDFGYVCDWTSDAIVAALMQHGRSPGLPNTSSSALYNGIGLLAVRVFLPDNAHEVPAKKVVEIRERYHAEFLAFLDEIEAAAADLSAALADIAEASVLEAYVKSEVENRFVKRAEDLEKALRGLNIATASTTVTTKFEVPALLSVTAAGVMAHQPLVAGSSAVAAGLLGVYTRMREQRKEILAPSGATYLYDMRRALTPPSHLAKVAQKISRIGTGKDSGN
ncbi:hypothetical protein ABH920_005640 [Catenulispora sp. EB89]|uniref:DUF6236 family protein n=1 Tax=Catenulispora sp. EB89 TaxID=3156257 RepID=UPI003514DF5D